VYNIIKKANRQNYFVVFQFMALTDNRPTNY